MNLKKRPAETPIDPEDPIAQLQSRAEHLLELVDGAYDLVEIYHASSPAQIQWKKNWLAKAKSLGANPSW